VGRRGEESSARVSTGRVRCVRVRQSEVDCSPPSNVGDGQGRSEDPPLGPAGRGEVFTIPGGWDAGPGRSPTRAAAKGSVKPDGALKRSMVAAGEGSGNGAQARACARDVDADVVADYEGSDGLTKKATGCPDRGRRPWSVVRHGWGDVDWGRGWGRSGGRGRGRCRGNYGHRRQSAGKGPRRLCRKRRWELRRRGKTAQHLLDEGGIACFVVARA
jgi:hypothetical protein